MFEILIMLNIVLFSTVLLLAVLCPLLTLIEQEKDKQRQLFQSQFYVSLNEYVASEQATDSIGLSSQLSLFKLFSKNQELFLTTLLDNTILFEEEQTRHKLLQFLNGKALKARFQKMTIAKQSKIQSLVFETLVYFPELANQETFKLAKSSLKTANLSFSFSALALLFYSQEFETILESFLFRKDWTVETFLNSLVRSLDAQQLLPSFASYCQDVLEQHSSSLPSQASVEKLSKLISQIASYQQSSVSHLQPAFHSNGFHSNEIATPVALAEKDLEETRTESSVAETLPSQSLLVV